MKELCKYQQWCIADKDKIPRDLSGKPISVWEEDLYTCQQAWEEAKKRGWNIGFILRKEDPFCCIDLDFKDGMSLEETQRHQSIIEAFDSYTEYSLSGKGYHIWVKGNLEQGKRRDKVEIYSWGRFIICTGKAYVNKEIKDGQEIIDKMVSQMTDIKETVTLEEVEEEKSDEEIIRNCSGNNRFKELWSGRWMNLGYPSGSEGDFALLNILAAHSVSNSQVRRLFRESEQGKRVKNGKIKADRDEYLNGMLGIIRRDIIERGKEDEYHKQYGEKVLLPIIQRLISAKFHKPITVTPSKEGLERQKEFDWPPGLTGELAQHFFHVSSRPVKEISIATALGVLAGICGKAYNINETNLTGLNNYFVVIAKSAIGKEAIHNNIEKLVDAMERKGKFFASQFFIWNRFASPEGMIRILSKQKSVLHIYPEFGDFLKRLHSDRDIMAQGIQALLKEAYTKSGRYSVFRGIDRSKEDESVEATRGMSYSIIGDTTPGVYYESITTDMMEGGLSSRFTTIEYKGDRPNLNANELIEFPNSVVAAISQLLDESNTLNQMGTPRLVLLSPEAKAMLDSYNEYCDKKIRSHNEEDIRQIFNRAHLKAWRIAATLACLEDPLGPIVTRDQMYYAVDFIDKANRAMVKSVDSGVIQNNNDESRMRSLKDLLSRYLTGEAKGYKADRLKPFGFISHSTIMSNLSSAAPFRKYRDGNSTLAIKNIIGNCIDSGILREITDVEKSSFNLTGKIYQILEYN